MKVTKEHEDAFFKALEGIDTRFGHVMAALQAMLDLIDPVPEGVNVIIDSLNRKWLRVFRNTWACDRMSLAYSDLEEAYGPITWEGKDA